MRIAPLGILLILAGQAASGHEFWIEPDAFRGDSGRDIALSFQVGQMLEGADYPFTPGKLRDFFALQGDTRIEIRSDPGARPAGRLRLDRAGLGIVAYESAADMLSYDSWEDFLSFLDYEGLSGIAERHQKRGLPQAGFREAYFRSAKLLVQVGVADPAETDRVTGLPLELIALGNPYAMTPGDRLTVELRFLDAPLPNHPVAVFWTGPDEVVLREMLRTDSAGRVDVPLHAGAMLVNAVQMTEPRDGLGVDWISIWASLSFAVG